MSMKHDRMRRVGKSRATVRHDLNARDAQRQADRYNVRVK